MVTGSYIEPEDEIVLICEEELLDGLVRVLTRIGLDKVVGWVPSVEVSGVSGLAAAPEMTAEQLRTKAESHGSASRAVFVLDTRNEHEHAEGSIAGSLNIAHTRLKPRLDELPQDKPLLCHCRSGVRSAAATAYLSRLGYDVTNLAGGFIAWEEAGGEIARGEAAKTQ